MDDLQFCYLIQIKLKLLKFLFTTHLRSKILNDTVTLDDISLTNNSTVRHFLIVFDQDLS